MTDNGSTTSYTANNVNQYVTINAATPTHNGNGDLLSDGTRSYTWNGRSELLSVTTGSATASFTYDALQRRISRTDSADTVYFIHDGWNVVAEYKKTNSTTMTQLRRYTWGDDVSGSKQGAGGIGGLLLAEEIAGSVITPNYYHYDGNGNVIAITDASAALVAAYRYDAYGRTLSASGAYAAMNRYRFSTKPVELASGLYFYGYRFYDPDNGRWTARDPIGEVAGHNIYLVVSNEATNRIDILGLAPCKASKEDIYNFIQAGGKQAVDKARDQKPKCEWGGKVCCSGNKLYNSELVSDGKPDGVNTAKARCKEGDETVGLFHNHPNGMPLSEDDIKVARRGKPSGFDKDKDGDGKPDPIFDPLKDSSPPLIPVGRTIDTPKGPNTHIYDPRTNEPPFDATSRRK